MRNISYNKSHNFQTLPLSSITYIKLIEFFSKIGTKNFTSDPCFSNLVKLQWFSQHFQTFWCFTKFSFHQRWNEARLLVINIIYHLPHELPNNSTSFPAHLFAIGGRRKRGFFYFLKLLWGRGCEKVKT